MAGIVGAAAAGQVGNAALPIDAYHLVEPDPAFETNLLTHFGDLLMCAVRIHDGNVRGAQAKHPSLDQINAPRHVGPYIA